MLLSDVCLSDVCLCLSVAYIGPKSRTERPRKTKIGTEVAHVTRDSDTTFKVKGQGHQAGLLTAALARQAAAAVGVGTCWPWETAATLPSARPREVLQHPRGEERGGGISWRPPTYSLFLMITVQNPNLFECYIILSPTLTQLFQWLFYRFIWLSWLIMLQATPLLTLGHQCQSSESKKLYTVVTRKEFPQCTFSELFHLNLNPSDYGIIRRQNCIMACFMWLLAWLIIKDLLYDCYSNGCLLSLV